MSLPDRLDKPRNCSLRKWADFAGYGFNLHAEKGKSGQYIGKVDPSSPSDIGGLRANDMVVEVNGINVEGFTHQQVVERIKAIPDKVTLFVCTMETYKYCKDNDIHLASNLPFVVHFNTPASRPGSEVHVDMSEVNNHEDQNRSSTPEQEVVAAVEAALEEERAPSPARSEPVEDSPPPSFYSQEAPAPVEETKRADSPPAIRNSSPEPPAAEIVNSAPPQTVNTHSNPPPGADPVGNLSLEEMRAKLGKNKRNEVKMHGSSFSEKYQVFQSL